MMRRLFVLILPAFMISLPLAQAGAASKDPLPRGPMMKLTNGFTNMLTAPAEFWARYAELEKKHNPMAAFIGGTLYGTFFTVGRLATGAFEVATFPFPFPGNYDTVMTPPTAVESYQKVLRDEPV